MNKYTVVWAEGYEFRRYTCITDSEESASNACYYEAMTGENGRALPNSVQLRIIDHGPVYYWYELVFCDTRTGETDNYYKRLSGDYWLTDLTDPYEVIDEMRQIDPEAAELLDSIDNDENSPFVYWVEPIGMQTELEDGKIRTGGQAND